MGFLLSFLFVLVQGAEFADQFPLFPTSSLDMFILGEKNDIGDAHRVCGDGVKVGFYLGGSMRLGRDVLDQDGEVLHRAVPLIEVRIQLHQLIPDIHEHQQMNDKGNGPHDLLLCRNPRTNSS